MYKSDAIDLFYPGFEGSPYYRIPSLAKLKNGNLIGACDQRLRQKATGEERLSLPLGLKSWGKIGFQIL